MIINTCKKEEKNKDYNALENKPKINGHELSGDLTSEQLGLNGGTESSSYDTLLNKPKLNGCELIGDQKIKDLGVTYLTDLRDDSELLTYEETADMVRRINNGQITAGFRDKYVIPDKRSTGVAPETNFSQLTATGPIGIVAPGYEGDPLNLALDPEKKFYILSAKLNKNIADRIIIENYDFTNMNDFYSTYTENFTPHKEKEIIITFRNCKMCQTRLNSGKVYYKFEHCTFEGNVSGCNISADYCYFHRENGDAINPALNFYVTNSYIADLSRGSQSGEIHIDGTQMFGLKDNPCGNVHFNNVRYSIPQFYFDGQNKSHVNGALMFQVEFGPAVDNVEFKNIMVDMGGSHYPCFATYYEDRKFSNISFKNIVASDMYSSTFRDDNWTNGIAKIANSRIESDLYVTSIWKDNYEQDLHLLCTNNSCHSDKILTVVTDKDTFKFKIPRCPSQDELLKDPKYQGYTFKDMPYDIQIDIPFHHTTRYIICYDGNKQIRYKNFEKENNFVTDNSFLASNYETLHKKPKINGVTLTSMTNASDFKEYDNYVESEYNDYILIPDEENTGLYDVSKLTTTGFTHPDNLDPKNEHPEWKTFKGSNLIFIEDQDSLYIDFGPAAGNNWQIKGEYTFENIDFSAIKPHVGINQLQSYRGGQEGLLLKFFNCRFQHFDTNVWDNDRSRGELKLFFEDCEFTDISARDSKLNRCFIHDSAGTLGKFGEGVEIRNCYFKNNQKAISQNLEAEVYGLQIKAFTNFYAMNCRIEIPRLTKVTGNIRKKAMISIPSSSKLKCLFERCYFNGGAVLLNTDNFENLRFVRPIFGNNVSEDTFTLDLCDTFFNGYGYKNNILVGSDIIEPDGLSFIMTNWTNEIKTIKIITDLGSKTYTLQPIPQPNNTLTFQELPIDQKITYPGSPHYALIYCEDHVIRTWSLDGRKIPKPTITAINDPPFGYKTIVIPEALEPNTLYVFSEPIENLTIPNLKEAEGYSEYSFIFISSSNGTNLNLPAEIKWDGNVAPTLKANTKYQVVISEKIAYISRGVTV